MVDAKTTSRWYLVITMGRGAGHLAVGIGKAAGATLTLIPEEFLGRRIRLKAVVDTLVGAIIKRLSYGRLDGVAVVAEGLARGIDPADLAGVGEEGRDRGRHFAAGGPIRPYPVCGDDRPRDGPGAHAAGGHHIDALRDRAPLHDPPAARRLRRPARAGALRRDRARVGGGVPP